MYNFEIEIRTKSPVPFSALNSILLQNSIQISEFHVMDNWQFENDRTVLPEFCEEHFETIENGSIVMLRGEKDGIPCGLYVYKEEREYCCLYWRRTDDRERLDTNAIVDANRRFYKNLSEYLAEVFSKYGLLYAAMGCEMGNDSKNTSRFEPNRSALSVILPKDADVLSERNYKTEEIKDFRIYFRVKKRES